MAAEEVSSEEETKVEQINTESNKNKNKPGKKGKKNADLDEESKDEESAFDKAGSA